MPKYKGPNHAWSSRHIHQSWLKCNQVRLQPQLLVLIAYNAWIASSNRLWCRMGAVSTPPQTPTWRTWQTCKNPTINTCHPNPATSWTNHTPSCSSQDWTASKEPGPEKCNTSTTIRTMCSRTLMSKNSSEHTRKTQSGCGSPNSNNIFNDKQKVRGCIYSRLIRKST